MYNFLPLSRKQANEFVNTFHRHNKPAVGDKFRVGLMDETGELIGVGQAGRPVARMLDNGETIEILRVCIKEGHKNACSMIYARLAKIAKLLGYKNIITYTLTRESGASMRALGAVQEKIVKSQQWSRPSRARKEQNIYNEEKIRWHI